MYYHKMCGKSKDFLATTTSLQLKNQKRVIGGKDFTRTLLETVHTAHLMNLGLLPVAPDIAKLERAA
jgi:hypothetical protein